MNVKRRFTDHTPAGNPHTLAAAHPAVREGRTMYLARRAKASLQERLFKSGEHNRKVGGNVVKGQLAGLKIFTLTLEERATCPSTCIHWRDCYGNNMNWPRRVQVDEDLMPLLEAELIKLVARHGKILVRLHVLGDFFSVPYVTFWRHMLVRLPGLHVYGYTARLTGEIAEAIELMNRNRRCWIRYSDGPEGSFREVTVDNTDQATAAGAIVCPAQGHSKADTISCGSCALCWSTDKTIAFLRH